MTPDNLEQCLLRSVRSGPCRDRDFFCGGGGLALVRRNRRRPRTTGSFNAIMYRFCLTVRIRPDGIFGSDRITGR